MVGLRLNRLALVGAPFARFGLKRREATRAPSAGISEVSAKEPHLIAYTSDADTRARRVMRRAITTVLISFCLFQGLVFAFFAPYLIPIFLVVPATLLVFVIWALPASVNPPTRTMERLFVALFVVMLMWPNYLAVSLPGLPWITLIRLTGFPLVFLFAVSLSQSQSVRTEIKESLRATPWIWALMVGLMAIIILTLPMSRYLTQSLQKVFLIATNWIALYLISVYFFRKNGRVTLWVLLLTAMMIGLGAIAVVEAHVRHILWSNSIPSFLKVQDPTIIALLHGSGRRFTNIYRAQTTFETALGFGEFIAIVFPFSIYFIVSDQYKMVLRVAAAIVSFFFVYVALLSGSRSAVLGALVSTMLILGVWGVLRWRDRKNSLLGPAVVLSYPIAGALVLAATLVVGRIRNKVWGGAETVSSTQARIDQWHQGTPRILSNPFGHGAENAGIILNYRLPSGQLVIDSYFLKILLDWGVVGFLTLFGMIAAAIIYSGRMVYYNVRNDREVNLLVPVAVSLFTWFTIKFVNAEDTNHPIIFMMLGIVTALAYREDRNSQRTAYEDGDRDRRA